MTIAPRFGSEIRPSVQSHGGNGPARIAVFWIQLIRGGEGG
jgi:hypothetical protein